MKIYRFGSDYVAQRKQNFSSPAEDKSVENSKTSLKTVITPNDQNKVPSRRRKGMEGKGEEILASESTLSKEENTEVQEPKEENQTQVEAEPSN